MLPFSLMPRCYVEVSASDSDLLIAIPDDVDPLQFIIDHLREYKFQHINAIRVFYYDADYSGR